jgi:hypothetical protein
MAETRPLRKAAASPRSVPKTPGPRSGIVGAMEIPAPLPDGRQSETASRICRGVRRHLGLIGYASFTEVTLRSGRRADLVALGRDGEIVIVEIKSSIADLRADAKWPDYRRHCDRFLFATHEAVPAALFPMDAGLMVADAYGAHLLREAPTHPLSAATRKEMLIRLATGAGRLLHRLVDPAAESPPE